MRKFALPQKQGWIIIIFSCILLACVGFSLFKAQRDAYAQTSDDIWAKPINLSNSGGTSNPSIIIDANGTIHVIWQDAYKGTMYTGINGNVWNIPEAIILPFSPPISAQQPGAQAAQGPVPTFRVDNSGNIHAFWTDEQDRLFSSYVPSLNFSNPGSWSTPAQLAESAVDFDVVVDSQGQLHLAYVRALDSTEFPAGIYYRSSNDNGLSWGVPTNLYQSPYFRSLKKDNANVGIEAPSGSADGSLFVTWDNRLRKQVYFARSLDGGTSWEQPQLIDSPTEENPGALPVNIQAVEQNNNVLLFWQDGDPTTSCIQYYQSSVDGGNTWSERQKMLDQISGCPQESYFFKQNGLLFMMANVQGQVYLLAWDGSQWSLPQLQKELLGFEDSETFNNVIFDCRSPVQNPAGNLFVVGCDTGGGGDIWLTSRALGDVSPWFPPPSAWTSPEQVTTVDTPITNPILLADSQGRLHAFWVQKNIPASSSTDTGSTPGSARDAIFYSRKDNDQWTRPVAVLQSPSGMTRQPAAAIDGKDNLYVVWSGGEAGEIYFSRASGSRANNPAEWVEPTLLPSVRQAGSSPDIEIAENGNIHVAYAIPLNENRGVYVVHSTDGGVTWSEPVLAFDAVQEDWEMVDQPHIAVGGDGTIKLTMARFSLPGGSGSKGLYATRSRDGLENWSDLETLTQLPVRWNEVLNFADGNLLRAWLESSVGGDFFQYQLSNDQGVSWTPPASISTIGEIVSSPDLASDISGQAYLFLPILDPAQGFVIRNWRWDRTQWNQEGDFILGDSNNIKLTAVAAEVMPDGRLGLVYSASVEDAEIETVTDVIEFSDRTIDVPVKLTTSSPEPTLQPTTSTEINPSALALITPTVVVPTLAPLNQNEVPLKPSNTWIGLTFGTVLAVLVAVVVIAFGFIRLKRRS